MFDTLERLDKALFLKINSLHNSLFDTIMWQLSESWHTYLFTIILAFIFYKKYSAKKAVEFLLGCALIIACTDFSSNTIKHAVKRYRPTHNLEIKSQVHLVNNYEGGKYGFFSGHAANVFGLTSYVFLCLHGYNKKHKLLLVLYPIIVCYSRIYLGVHYPSDIFIGMIDGLFFGTLGYFIVNRYFLKLDEKTT